MCGIRSWKELFNKIYLCSLFAGCQSCCAALNVSYITNHQLSWRHWMSAHWTREDISLSEARRKSYSYKNSSQKTESLLMWIVKAMSTAQCRGKEHLKNPLHATPCINNNNNRVWLFYCVLICGTLCTFLSQIRRNTNAIMLCKLLSNQIYNV